MHIKVGGIEREYDEGLSVKELIDAEGVDEPLYVTVAINDEFVRNDDFETSIIHDGDEIEFMYFMGGGVCR